MDEVREVRDATVSRAAAVDALERLARGVVGSTPEARAERLLERIAARPDAIPLRALLVELGSLAAVRDLR